jgi:hypothetical protein
MNDSRGLSNFGGSDWVGEVQELAEKTNRDLISSQEPRSPDPANREQSAALYNE